MKMSESDTWTDKRERRVFAACVTERVFSSEYLSLEVLLRFLEKKTRRVSSIGWKTMRAISEPMKKSLICPYSSRRRTQ